MFKLGEERLVKERGEEKEKEKKENAPDWCDTRFDKEKWDKKDKISSIRMTKEEAKKREEGEEQKRHGNAKG